MAVVGGGGGGSKKKPTVTADGMKQPRSGAGPSQRVAGRVAASSTRMGAKKTGASPYARAVPRGKGGGAGTKATGGYAKYAYPGALTNTSAKKFNAYNASVARSQGITPHLVEKQSQRDQSAWLRQVNAKTKGRM